MKDGIMMQTAVPLDLYGSPACRFVGGFIGSPPMNFLEGRIDVRNGEVYFSNGSLDLQAAGDMSAKLGPYAGKAVTFGIRPEDIYDRSLAGNVAPDNVVQAQVDVVEPMGAEVYLYISTGGQSLTARVDVHTGAKVDSTLDFIFDMRKVHFFDKDTEQTIV